MYPLLPNWCPHHAICGADTEETELKAKAEAADSALDHMSADTSDHAVGQQSQDGFKAVEGGKGEPHCCIPCPLVLLLSLTCCG